MLYETDLLHTYILQNNCAGNDMDVTKLDLASILPGPTVMVVTVSASNSHGQALTPEELSHVMEACNMAFELQAALEKMLAVSLVWAVK